LLPGTTAALTESRYAATASACWEGAAWAPGRIPPLAGELRAVGSEQPATVHDSEVHSASAANMVGLVVGLGVHPAQRRVSGLVQNRLADKDQGLESQTRALLRLASAAGSTLIAPS
jgi:hypothetical protein